jgi:hypothetical protein
MAEDWQEKWARQREEQRIERERMLSGGKIIALEKWKENNVDHVNFIFDCGGDSMNETSIEIYDKDDNVIEVEEISNYIDEAVYNYVNFYEASDGHYMGEAGTVIITISDDDENDFDWCKNSESEWCESELFTEKFELTDEEVEFIDKYVDDINGSMAEDDYNVNYKADFVQTDELVALEEKLVEKIKTYFENYETNLDNMSDWHTLEVQGDTLDKDNKTIDLEMSFQHYVYRESED